MSKKKTKAQIIEDDNRTKTGQQAKKKKTKDQLCGLCRNYLEKKELFKWFIEKYYGLQKYLDLWELAENNQEAHLRSELNSIWFELPDSVFNIRCAPPGWESFVSLIDE